MTLDLLQWLSELCVNDCAGLNGVVLEVAHWSRVMILASDVAMSYISPVSWELHKWHVLQEEEQNKDLWARKGACIGREGRQGPLWRVG